MNEAPCRTVSYCTCQPPARVALPDGVREREAAPRALAEFVGGVVNDPVGAELAGDVHFSTEDALPVEGVARPACDAAREVFDAQEAAAGESLDRRCGAVRG